MYSTHLKTPFRSVSHGDGLPIDPRPLEVGLLLLRRLGLRQRSHREARHACLEVLKRVQHKLRREESTF